MSNLQEITFQQIKEKLLHKDEIAIVDLREEHIYAQGHPLFTTNISLSRLEVEILNRIPRLTTTVVLYDDGDGRVERAYEKLVGYGYNNLYVLKGGASAWQAQGGELFIDVNSATKAFGEWVEHYKATPSLSAEEVQAKIDAKENIVILDARRFDEYNTMSIPTGRSVPGAELVYRAPELVKDENTTIIVNCAGRTRSIIGTQSLINAQISHPVYALRNGTIGWILAGQKLEQGQIRSYKDDAKQYSAQYLENAKSLADQAKVKTINYQELIALRADLNKTTYVFDVRDESEYQTSHLANSRWIAGGQLVQETDHYAAVRGARIILIDDQLIRAYMTGSWLAQMNWEVYVLDDHFAEIFTEKGEWKPRLPQINHVRKITPQALHNLSKDDVMLFDVSTYMQYKKGHIPHAQWVLKAEILERIGSNQIPLNKTIVVTCHTGILAAFGAEEIQIAVGQHFEVFALDGGNQAWAEAGYELEQSAGISLSPQIDRYKRPYEGTDNSKEAMQAYLDWEFGLVEQLKRDATHGFYVV